MTSPSAQTFADRLAARTVTREEWKQVQSYLRQVERLIGIELGQEKFFRLTVSLPVTPPAERRQGRFISVHWGSK